MGAKSKLNAAYIQGALVIAGALGILTESLTVFMIALIGLLVASYMADEIRI